MYTYVCVVAKINFIICICCSLFNLARTYVATWFPLINIRVARFKIMIVHTYVTSLCSLVLILKFCKRNVRTYGSCYHFYEKHLKYVGRPYHRFKATQILYLFLVKSTSRTIFLAQFNSNHDYLRNSQL